jgi:hypothetical protein
MTQRDGCHDKVGVKVGSPSGHFMIGQAALQPESTPSSSLGSTYLWGPWH